jgi:hypothetical protein
MAQGKLGASGKTRQQFQGIVLFIRLNVAKSRMRRGVSPGLFYLGIHIVGPISLIGENA